jgi:hypothetical protein
MFRLRSADFGLRIEQLLAKAIGFGRLLSLPAAAGSSFSVVTIHLSRRSLREGGTI